MSWRCTFNEAMFWKIILPGLYILFKYARNNHLRCLIGEELSLETQPH